MRVSLMVASVFSAASSATPISFDVTCNRVDGSAALEESTRFQKGLEESGRRCKGHGGPWNLDKESVSLMVASVLSAASALCRSRSIPPKFVLTLENGVYKSQIGSTRVVEGSRRVVEGRRRR